jgi:hypothetical protein
MAVELVTTGQVTGRTAFMRCSCWSVLIIECTQAETHTPLSRKEVTQQMTKRAVQQQHYLHHCTAASMLV